MAVAETDLWEIVFPHIIRGENTNQEGDGMFHTKASSWFFWL